jgi:uncharacterized membrane protein YebE (DUF533 family)
MELAVSKILLQDNTPANSSTVLPPLNTLSSRNLQETPLQAQAAAAAAVGKHTLHTTQKQQRRRTRRATAQFTAPHNMSSMEQQHTVMVRAMVMVMVEDTGVHMGQRISCNTEPQKR